MTAHLHRRIVARGHARQAEAVAHADAIAAAAGRLLAGAWRRLLAVLREGGGPHEAGRKAEAVLRPVPAAVHALLAARLRRVAVWGSATARDSLRAEVPVQWLGHAVSAGVVHEAHGDSGKPRCGDRGGLPECHDHGRRDRGPEGRGVWPRIDGEGTGTLAGGTSLLEDESGSGVAVADLLQPLREPAAVDPAAARRLFDALLFAPPSAAEIDAYTYAPVAGLSWYQRAAHATAALDPRRLGSIVAAGYAAGKSQREIAQDLLPAFDGLQGARTRATRFARTEALRVSHAASWDASERLGPLVVGYQAHATLDSHTRSWHAARNGAVFYRAPGPGQKGFAQMPRPPEEPADPAERPPGTPQTAWS